MSCGKFVVVRVRSVPNMKKVVEFCIVCNEDTLHRRKRVCWKAKKRGESYASVMLPLRCFKCGTEVGKRPEKSGKRTKIVSLR